MRQKEMMQREKTKPCQPVAAGPAVVLPAPGYPLLGCSSAAPNSVSPDNSKFNMKCFTMRMEWTFIGNEQAMTVDSISIGDKNVEQNWRVQNRQKCTPGQQMKIDISAHRLQLQNRHNCTPGLLKNQTEESALLQHKIRILDTIEFEDINKLSTSTNVDFEALRA
jgi:hypothetical protein